MCGRNAIKQPLITMYSQAVLTRIQERVAEEHHDSPEIMDLMAGLVQPGDIVYVSSPPYDYKPVKVEFIDRVSTGDIVQFNGDYRLSYNVRTHVITDILPDEELVLRMLAA